MKKLFRALIPCLLAIAMLAAFTGCGYDVEGQVPHGEKGSMFFLGVNFNHENSLEEGVTVEVNFAHEKTGADLPYSLYAGSEGQYTSVYGLPSDFASSEEYNAKRIKEKEIVPGVVAYTCTFPKAAVEVTLPAALFSEASGTISLVLAAKGTDFSKERTLHAYELEYTVDGDSVTLE